MCKQNNKKYKKGAEDMSKLVRGGIYKKLTISKSKLEEITVTPKVKDGKLLFDQKSNSHRYIVED